MKLVLKILKLFAILIISVSVILFSASFLLQDKVAGIILKSLNKNISQNLISGHSNFISEKISKSFS